MQNLIEYYAELHDTNSHYAEVMLMNLFRDMLSQSKHGSDCPDINYCSLCKVENLLSEYLKYCKEEC